MYCNNCGTKLPDNAKFCNECGVHIGVVKNDENQSIGIIQTITETHDKKRRMPVFELILASLCVFFITFIPWIECNGVSYSCLNIFNDAHLVDDAAGICILGWGLTVSVSVGYVFLMRAERYVLSILTVAAEFAVLLLIASYERRGVSLSQAAGLGFFAFLMLLCAVASMISKKVNYALFSHERKKLKKQLDDLKSNE
ncbi:MAG: zinc ribbon domain-containing protein [Ruminococcus sp.]|nr:zinc ribbon domain-containing protein [Ruminococcus sp.]